MKGRTLRRVAALLLLAAAACRQGAEEAAPEPLETEEIGAPIDAAVTTEYDVRARSSEESVGARMPDDLPADLPLCGAGSLINYGPAGDGRRFIELSVPSTQEAVAQRCESRIEGGGWLRLDDGEFERRGRRIRLSYREGVTGTWVRIEYPASG